MPHGHKDDPPSSDDAVPEHVPDEVTTKKIRPTRRPLSDDSDDGNDRSGSNGVKK